MFRWNNTNRIDSSAQFSLGNPLLHERREEAMKQLTKEEAIAFFDSKAWEGWTSRQIAEFQLEQDRLCVPMDVFHKAIQETLGRPVFTHEFAFRDMLKSELYGEAQPPTFEEIVSLIPEGKRIIIFKKGGDQ